MNNSNFYKLLKKYGMTVVLLVVGLVVIMSQAPANVDAAGFERISVQEAANLIEANQNNPEFVILDVRTPQEWTQRKVVGSLGINYYDADFAEQLDQLDKSKTYLVYCRSGNRSGRTLPLMQELGFIRVYDIIGGINAIGNSIKTE
jgi:rhodanese-related sulfurtransferase